MSQPLRKNATEWGAIPFSAVDDREADGAVDVFDEARALQNCLRFLMASAEDLDLGRTVQMLSAAVKAIDADLDRYCN